LYHDLWCLNPEFEIHEHSRATVTEWGWFPCQDWKNWLG
jgi:hypothetical protein